VTKINLDPTTPEGAVYAFYTYLKVRDMDSGYKMLSQEYLKNTDYFEWTSRFRDILDVNILKVEKVNEYSDQVYVKFSTKNWVQEEVDIHHYEGTWETVLEDDVYKMLEANIIEVFDPSYDWFWRSF
jgi:hypothetical protein